MRRLICWSWTVAVPPIFTCPARIAMSLPSRGTVAAPVMWKSRVELPGNGEEATPVEDHVDGARLAGGEVVVGQPEDFGGAGVGRGLAGGVEQGLVFVPFGQQCACDVNVQCCFSVRQ